MTVLDAPAPDPAAPRPRPRRTGLAVGAGLLPLALLAGWLWVGTHPALAAGAGHHLGTMRTASDGVTDTRYVAPPGGGEMVVSLRNDGPTPVRVAAPPLEHRTPIVELLGLQLLDPRGGLHDPDGEWHDALVVPSGREAAVRLRVGTDGCTSYVAGSSAETDVLPLSVQALGLRSVQALPLPLPVTVVGPVEPGPQCEE